jgi:hypothetical protein
MASLKARFLLSLPGNKAKYFQELYELAYTINGIDGGSIFWDDYFFLSVRLLWVACSNFSEYMITCLWPRD